MDQAEGLEQTRVAAFDPQRHQRSADLAGHAHHLRRPDRIVHASGLQPETGDFAGRESQNAASRAQVRQDPARAGDVTRIGAVGAERIDLDEPGADAGNLAEPPVADDERIRPGAQEEVHRDQPVGESVRMIGDHHERAGLRDAREALVAPSIAQTGLLHRRSEEIRPPRRVDAFQEGVEGPHLEEAVEDRFRPSQRSELSLEYVGVVGSGRR